MYRKWGVGHERSGLSLGWYADEPEQAIAFAATLGTMGDWTIPGDLVPTVFEAYDVRCIAESMGLVRGGKLYRTGDQSDVNPLPFDLNEVTS
jgi:hypothetical protein